MPTVSGTITQQTGRPLIGAIVQVFDKKDIRSELFRGEAITDRNGAYTITVDDEQRRQPSRRQANLLVRVFDAEGATLGESAVLYKAPAEATINITVTPRAPPQLSEHEQLRADLAPFAEGVAPRDFVDDQIEFLAGASRAARGHITTLRQADRIAEDAELSTDFVYAALRQGLAPDDDGLFDPDQFTTAVEQAIETRIIPERLRSSLGRSTERLRELHAERRARREATFVLHQAVGKLLDDQTGEPLVGYTLRVLNLDTDPPAELGTDISNARGLFGVGYRLDPDTPEEETARRVRLEVLDDAGDVIHSVDDIIVTGNPEDVFEVRLPPLAAAVPDSPAISELGLALPPALTDFLAQKNIRTLADIRAIGSLALADGLPLPPDDAVVRALDAHANLNLVSSDLEVSKALIAESITDIARLADAPRARIVTLAHERMGDVKAYEMQVAAKARTAVARNVLTQSRVAQSNGIQLGFESVMAALDKLHPPKCSCEDCEAAVSPLAYLADLLNYALDHVENDGKPINLGFLEETFLQPFAKLPADCDAMDRRVRQVRLCIEVLRRYLEANNLPATVADKAALAKAENAYRLGAYQTLLTKIGASYEELRNARSASEAVRGSLAERLGIAVKHLDALLLAIRARPAQLTEAALETRFGLVDTHRDPLLDSSKPELEKWRQDFLRTQWQQRDWPEDAYSDGTLPTIDPDLIGPDDFRAPYAKANAADPDRAFDLWLQRRAVVDTLVAEMAAAREDQGLAAHVIQELGQSLAELAQLQTDLSEGSPTQREAATQALAACRNNRQALKRGG